MRLFTTHSQSPEVIFAHVSGLKTRPAAPNCRAHDRGQTNPHFSYVEEIEVMELEALRVQLNGQACDARPRLSPLAFIMRAVARLLPAYLDINATFDEEAGILRPHAAIHMGVSTQTERGLMVPVVRHVERRDLCDCAREIARVAGSACSGNATREELSGSTLTLTSLGPLGGIAATPVINHPGVAILGPNRIVERPAVRAGAIVIRKLMHLSSSFDHRVIDGHQAAEFIQRVKALLERPALIFI
jgi:2-oxoisovalerate dehydrogenase E2 component (dihydrolipoyl transacylase)